MSKPIKITIGLIIIAVFIIVGFISFVDSKIEYVDFKEAQKRLKTVEVKGVWVKEKDAKYDGAKNTFTFFMKDDSNTEMKVVLDGAKPNNFDVADMIVAKGKVKEDTFYAKDVLTKCPSKYEATSDQVKQTK